MNTLKQFFLFTLAILLLSSVHSQESNTVQDFQLWSGINLKKNFLEKKLQFKITQEFRFEDNVTSIDNYFTEAEVGYELFKNLQVDAGYRFIRNNRNSGYRNQGRFFADANYTHEWKRLKFAYRFRFQNQHVLESATNVAAVNKYRLRFKLDYNIRNWKLDPYFSAEGFLEQTTVPSNTNPPQEEESISGIEKIRFTIGTDYDISERINLDVSFRYERELGTYSLHENTVGNFFIAGLNLNFDL